jgi:hypothetical protein
LEKHRIKNITLLVLTLFSAVIGVQSAQAEVCLDIGRVVIANFYAQGEAKPIIISATSIGSVQNAAGKITAQRTAANGLEMDMEHYFSRAEGGSITTKDLGILTAVPGRPGRFMMEITYEIQDGKSRGTLKGYRGSFKSFGLVDLQSEIDMKGLVRYEGNICK